MVIQTPKARNSSKSLPVYSGFENDSSIENVKSDESKHKSKKKEKTKP